MAVGPKLMAHDYNVDSALWPGEGVVPTLNPVGKPARFRSSAEELATAMRAKAMITVTRARLASCTKLQPGMEMTNKQMNSVN